jgi:hypothetical protein
VWMLPGVCSLPAVSRPARAAACAASSFTHKWLGVADMPLGSRYEAPLFSAFEVCFVVSSARMSDTCPKCFPPVLLTVLTCASWGHCFALCCWFWGMCVLGLLLLCSTHPCVLGLLLLCSVCCAGIGAMSACCVPS